MENLKVEFLNNNVNIRTIFEFNMHILTSGLRNLEVIVLILENLKIIISRKLYFSNMNNNQANLDDNAIDILYEIMQDNSNNYNLGKICLELILEILKYLKIKKLKEEPNKYPYLSENSVKIFFKIFNFEEKKF